MSEILILYFSRAGSTEKLAREVCRGVDSVAGMSARLRTVPAVSATTEATEADVPDAGPPYASNQDLVECAGVVMGSPTRFGNMDASLKYFIDNTAGEWMSAACVGKPFGLFTSTSSLHGGQESTLLSMALPLIHHGMIYVGVPYSETALSTTRSGGTPYGPTHVTWNRDADALSDEEKELARALGRRVAVKVLPKQALRREKDVRRFHREAQTAAKLHHTNIVPVFGVGQAGGQHYYVMQYIHGLGLDDVIGTTMAMVSSILR